MKGLLLVRGSCGDVGGSGTAATPVTSACVAVRPLVLLPVSHNLLACVTSRMGLGTSSEMMTSSLQSRQDNRGVGMSSYTSTHFVVVLLANVMSAFSKPMG